MKEIYEKPVAELEKFNEVEIITVSGDPGDDNPVPWPFG